MGESKLHCEECEPNTAGELLKSLRTLAGGWASDVPANGSFHADGISEGIRGCGRTLQRLLGEYDAAAAGALPAGGTERYALVEQMGHRATTGTVRETTFCGAPMLEITDLKTGSVHLASPQSLYEVTWLTEPEARQRANPWTAVALPAAADPWGTAESDLDDEDEDDDENSEDSEDSEDEDDGTITSEPHEADQPRDPAPEAGAHPWFGPAGAAAPPANPIEAAAKRAVGWPQDQPQQQAPADGAGAQTAQRMML